MQVVPGNNGPKIRFQNYSCQQQQLRILRPSGLVSGASGGLDTQCQITGRDPAKIKNQDGYPVLNRWTSEAT